MYVCVTYDIGSNRLRLRVSRHCRRIGLLRMQRSVFIGRLRRGENAELETETRAALAPTDRFAVIQMDQPGYQNLLRQNDDPSLLPLQQRFTNWYF